MARPRLPLARAMMTGAAAKNPGRYRDRRQPGGTAPLGPPPAWMRPASAAAWRDLAREVPWLTSADRGVVEIAATIRGRMASGEPMGASALNLLRQCLGAMGATPADATRVPKPAGDDADPDAGFFP